MVLFLLLGTSIQRSACFSDATGLLSYVNALRSRHGAPNVSYGTDLESGAQAWATHMASIEKLVHSPYGYSENLAAVPASWPWTRAIDLWYQTGAKYNYTNPAFASTTGSFTALVWARVARIGFGYEATGDPAQPYGFYVMWFDPPGNEYGQFLKNVKPPIQSPTLAKAPPRWPASKTYVPFPPPRPRPRPSPATNTSSCTCSCVPV
jgi:hypothetical protein